MNWKTWIIAWVVSPFALALVWVVLMELFRYSLIKHALNTMLKDFFFNVRRAFAFFTSSFANPTIPIFWFFFLALVFLSAGLFDQSRRVRRLELYIEQQATETGRDRLQLWKAVSVLHDTLNPPDSIYHKYDFPGRMPPDSLFIERPE